MRRVAPLALLAVALATGVATSAAGAQDTPESAQAKRDVLWAQMADSIRAIAQRTHAVVGVAITDLTDHRTFALNADAIFPTASTIKIAVLAELYRQDARGAGARLADRYVVQAADQIGESDILGGLTPGVTTLTNRDLATMMVAVSDNAATNLLIQRVGMDSVNAWLGSLGLMHTRLRRKMLDVAAAKAGRENTATPRELVTLLERLHGGALGPRATDEFFRMLATNKMSYLPRLLPDSVRVANKPGWLDAVRNDAGVVFVHNRPFAIAVMTTFGTDAADQELAIARIAYAAWGYFDRVGKSSTLGRIVK